jgi:hypothetical protein
MAALNWFLVTEKSGKVQVWSHQMTWTTDSSKAVRYLHPTEAKLVLDSLNRMGEKAQCLRVEDLDRLLLQQTLMGIADGQF